MFDWNVDLSSKKLLIEDDCLTVKVKDGSGFKTSIGDMVLVSFSLIHEFIGFQTRRPLLLLNQVELRKSSEDWHLSEGRSHRLSKSLFLIIYVMLGFL